MREKLAYIELSGEKLPIKCDLVVLEAAQEEYGTVNEFERKLLGIKFDENKKKVQTEPSFKTIRFALVQMVNEGIDVENALNGEKKKHLSEAELVNLCTDVNVFEVANILHNEFERCFQAKNLKSTQEQEETSK